MSRLDRRSFLKTSVVTGAAAALPSAPGSAMAAAASPEKAMPAPTKPPAAAAPAAPEQTEVTRKLARYLVEARYEDIPEAARKEAARALLNWIGVAVGGSRHETVEIAVAALGPYAGPGQATLFGRSERVDILLAALINGISSHVLDFDDTHLRTAIHPSAPVIPAILAFAEHNSIRAPVSGQALVAALVLGIETECRIGIAVNPQHYDIGWHITGTAGVFAAAAAIGRLTALDPQRMAWAIGLAATQPVGLRDMFGTMTKSFHPGRAAQSGLMAALLAGKGYTASETALEARCGWANVLSTRHDYGAILDGLGAHWEILQNSYKPFACGLVMHPAIDGMLRLRDQYGLKPEMIKSVALTVQEDVFERAAKPEPKTGLEGKFSVYHACAVAMITGFAGEAQFTDAMVQNPEIVALRRKITATVDPKIGKDQARVAMVLADGRTIDVFVEHAVGSVDNPMSDADLERKFLGLVDGILPSDRAHKLVEACWRVAALTDVGDLARATAVRG